MDYLKKDLLTIHPTAKDYHHMWKRECETASILIAEEKEYNKQRYDKTHKEKYFREWDQVLVFTLNFNKLKGPNKMRDSFVGLFTIIRLMGKNAVEVRLTEEFSRKHPVLPVSLVKPYHQTGEDEFHSRNIRKTPENIVEVEDCPGIVKNIMNARKIRLNGKGHIQYFVRFNNQAADKDTWLEEDAIPDGDIHLRIFRASRRAD
ncbi:hypothetical protein O181_023875 [Austropuccinia psidii MF-1]|uniref:Chromo domain-containing protein n=1 Tax=Austropuccinia psidii MF-1 TaxID=1389203 RepID=A0A9Q3CJF1_9BASI|nr:hypothetical protein [Austropuccinia psidii MF-1]